jgi:hypothetical protein
LGGDDAFGTGRDALSGSLEIRIQQKELIYFRFGKQNLPFVQLLPAVFGFLLARVFLRLLTRAGFLDLRLLTRAVPLQPLRFEANFTLTLFGSEL